MPKPTRGYLLTEDNKYRRLLWVQNNKPNEMLLGIYGLARNTPILRYMWPERTLDQSELENVRYQYQDAVPVGLALDHVTCHADGRFHVKTKDGSDLYVQTMKRSEALGPDTSIFLEVVVISDLARHYTISRRVKYPHIWFGVGPDKYLALRGMFSGVNYPVEKDMLATMAPFRGRHGGVVLTSGTLKGIFMGHAKALAGEALATRPRGTMLSFKFPVTGGKWHVKTFLLE
jgi:hypothetical protein